MERRLRKAGWVLRPPGGHGPRIPGIWSPAQPDWQADGLLLQLAGLPDLRGTSGNDYFNRLSDCNIGGGSQLQLHYLFFIKLRHS